MIHGNPDFCAPVASQMPPRPDRQWKKSCLDDRTNGDEKRKLGRQKTSRSAPAWNEEQQEGCTEHELMEISRHPGLGASGWRRA